MNNNILIVMAIILTLLPIFSCFLSIALWRPLFRRKEELFDDRYWDYFQVDEGLDDVHIFAAYFDRGKIHSIRLFYEREPFILPYLKFIFGFPLLRFYIDHKAYSIIPFTKNWYRAKEIIKKVEKNG